MRSPRLAPALALYALVAAGAALPPAALLASGHSLLWRDTANLFAPVRGFVMEALRHLRLPLWNPHEAFGLPLFAQMIHGVLHPVSLLGALLAPGAGMDSFVVAHVVLATLGATLLARTVGASRGAAALAGFAYGLSGYVLGMTAVLTYLVAGATAPWAIAGLRAAGEGRRGAVPLAALAVAALHFAGDPQWTMLAGLLGLALAIEAGGARGIGRCSFVLVLGTACAAVQLLPAWAFLEQTVRAGGLSPADRAQWALAPARLLELVAPGFFCGRPGAAVVSPVFLWLGGPSGSLLSIPFLPSVFLGAAVVGLAGAGALAPRTGRLLGVAAAVLLWLALGHYAGAQQLLQAVPLWGSFRYAEKVVGPLTLCLSLLAALGSDRLAAGPSARSVAIALAAASLACAGAILLGGWRELDTLAGGGLARQAAPVARERLAVGLAHAAGGLALLSGLLVAARRWPALRRGLPPAAAALVFAQSSAAAPFALHSGTRGVRDEAPLAALAARGTLVRIVTPLEDPPYSGPEGLDEVDRETAALSRMGVAPFAVPSGIDHVNTYTGLSPRRLRMAFHQLGPQLLWKGLRRFALTHVVLKQPKGLEELMIARAATDGGKLVLADPAWGFAAWEVPHRPWAAFARDAVPAAGEGQVLEALLDAERRGQPGLVVLEGHAATGLAPGMVLATLRRPERVRVEAISEGDALLVVNDSFWPGWAATLDGRPWPIWRADFLVRAVPWPPGRHVLEMRYEAPGLQVGQAVSVVALLGVLALGVLALRRPSIHPHPSVPP